MRLPPPRQSLRSSVGIFRPPCLPPRQKCLRLMLCLETDGLIKTAEQHLPCLSRVFWRLPATRLHHYRPMLAAASRLVILKDSLLGALPSPPHADLKLLFLFHLLFLRISHVSTHKALSPLGQRNSNITTTNKLESTWIHLLILTFIPIHRMVIHRHLRLVSLELAVGRPTMNTITLQKH